MQNPRDDDSRFAIIALRSGSARLKVSVAAYNAVSQCLCCRAEKFCNEPVKPIRICTQNDLRRRCVGHIHELYFFFYYTITCIL